MKITRSLLSILVALAVFVSGTLIAYAEDKNPPQPEVITGVLSKSPKNVGSTDLSLIVDAALANEISVEQLAKFMSSLNKQQYATMRSLILARLDVSVPVESAKVNSDSLQPQPKALTSYAYVETIENVWTWNYNPKIFASFYYNDANCDGDSTDMDYVFYYPVSTSAATKANLRWTTTNAAVYAVFMAAYSGNLSAFGYSYSEVRLCLGSAAYAVGLDNVANSVFIHY